MAPGDAFSGTLTLDPDTAADAWPDVVWYWGAIKRFTVTAGSYTVTLDDPMAGDPPGSAQRIQLWDDTTQGSQSDFLGVGARAERGAGDCSQASGLSIDLQDDTGAMLSDASLPIAPPDLPSGEGAVAKFQIGFGPSPQEDYVGGALATLTLLGIDTDEDGVYDASDACPADSTNDVDGDGVCGDVDNCPAAANPDQADLDGDHLGDPCDPDRDGDGVPDADDNCPATGNADQADTDGDGSGDACDVDHDADGDGLDDTEDNCPLVWNPSQSDFNENGVGDLCEEVACEAMTKACQKERRADERECDLAARLCRKACERRDKDCQGACAGAEDACHDAAESREADCLATPCIAFDFCMRAVTTDSRLCLSAAQEGHRSCRQVCADADCRAACRDEWRSDRQICRDNRRFARNEICRAPFDAMRECREDREACQAEVEGLKGGCLAACHGFDPCEEACRVEAQVGITLCIDEQGDCFAEAATL